MARTRDRRVAGLILLGPVSDIAGERGGVGRRVLARRVAAAERIARRDPEVLVARAWVCRSAARFVSLFRPGEAEDVFQYYRPDADWRALGRIRVPTAVIVGGRDEYLDRRAAAVVAAFERHAVATRGFAGIVIPRATHGFRGHEAVLARQVVRWARGVGEGDVGALIGVFAGLGPSAAGGVPGVV